MCIFGDKFTVVYDAPRNYPAYCFTNNNLIQAEVEKKGWKYILMDFPVSNDVAESTLQVKYIKFLQFEKEERFSFFQQYQNLIVVDHKQKLKDCHVEQILRRKTNKVFLKLHPDQPTIRIWDEVERSMHQERYSRNMPQTIHYINQKIKSGLSEYVCIPWCGLILYEHNDAEVKELADEVYNDIIEWRMPNDQIVWAMVSQKHTSIIQMIPANEIPVKWLSPELQQHKPRRIIKKIIKALVPYGLIKIRQLLKKRKG